MEGRHHGTAEKGFRAHLERLDVDHGAERKW